MEQPALRLEWLDPRELKENPANWRRHPNSQKQALQDVLSEVGWAGAILYNERTGRIIDGHLRKEIAEGQLAPVLIGSWTEEQELLILATFDPISAMAESDRAGLDALLSRIKTENDDVSALLLDIEERWGTGIGILPQEETDAHFAENPTREALAEQRIASLGDTDSVHFRPFLVYVKPDDYDEVVSMLKELSSAYDMETVSDTWQEALRRSYVEVTEK